MSANFCAVTADLNRYMAQLDRESAFDDACQSKVEDWLGDSDKIGEAWTSFEEYGHSIADDVARILTCHPDDFAMLAQRFFLDARDKIEAKFQEDAPDAVEADARQAEDDAAEAAWEAREDARHDYSHGREADFIYG